MSDTAAGSAHPTPASPAQSGSPVSVILVMCFGGMVAALMQTLVIPIQPELPKLLGTSVSSASWVITATLLGGAVAMPIAGRLGDMFGKQRVLIASALFLAAGSLVAALSDSVLPLVAGRTLQGLAMGFIPVGISLMREVTPPRLTSSAVAAMSATLGVGGAIGLPLSAWVAESLDWHALFWVSLGLALVVLVLIATLIPHVDDQHGGRLDVVGALGLIVGLVATLVAVSKGNTWGWTDTKTIGLFVGGVVVLVAWGWFELRHPDPLVDLRTTARPAVLLTNLAAIAVGFGMMALSIVMPQLLEMPTATNYGLGQSVLQAGLWMAPGGLMMMVFAPISSMMLNRIGAKYTLAIGALVIALGYLAAFFLMHAPWQILVAAVIGTSGVGIGYAAMPTLIMASVPIADAGAAVGLNALMRSIGTTVASAVMATLLTTSTTSLAGHEIPTEGAFKLCFAVGAVAALVAVAITMTIPFRSPKAEQAAAQVHPTEEPETIDAAR
ncbi:MFS transporter [Williamsia sterculiae]|uniref:Major Facilitator Superfamily protein n=1 Tax=Williamsia sterculiae TaxID=1344003 RepID=A0A1N7H8S1_9NOCA|nr:MFS transporter [Williamsia sterculiae]SIS21246.1 Major Facilitator Superfamily protein [Williamsia sterculiae]